MKLTVYLFLLYIYTYIEHSYNKVYLNHFISLINNNQYDFTVPNLFFCFSFVLLVFCVLHFSCEQFLLFRFYVCNSPFDIVVNLKFYSGFCTFFSLYFILLRFVSFGQFVSLMMTMMVVNVFDDATDKYWKHMNQFIKQFGWIILILMKCLYHRPWSKTTCLTQF